MDNAGFEMHDKPPTSSSSERERTTEERPVSYFWEITEGLSQFCTRGEQFPTAVFYFSMRLLGIVWHSRMPVLIRSSGAVGPHGLRCNQCWNGAGWWWSQVRKYLSILVTPVRNAAPGKEIWSSCAEMGGSPKLLKDQVLGEKKPA